MEKLRFRRFERMFTAMYPDGYLFAGRRRRAQEIWEAARTGVPPALAIIARRLRKGLFSEAYRNSSWAVFHRFQLALKTSRYHQHLQAADLWARARQGDTEALRVRAEVLHPHDEALLQQLKPSDPAALLPRRRRNEAASRTRGAAISKAKSSYAGPAGSGVLWLADSADLSSTGGAFILNAGTPGEGGPSFRRSESGDAGRPRKPVAAQSTRLSGRAGPP
jgi:hypothetical protein